MYTVLLVAIPILFPISCAAPGDIVSLEKRVKDNPESSQAHHELALAYLKRGIDWEGPRDVGVPTIVNKRWAKKAQKELQEAVELDPNFPEPHYWLKIIYNSQGRYKEADKESQAYIESMAQGKRRPKR
ncbi:MAG: tetratricopeptide repeat protein [Candidatus Brocadiales bacterium]